MHNLKIDFSNLQKNTGYTTFLTPVVIVLIATVGLATLSIPISTFALTIDMKNGDNNDDDDGTKQQGQAGGVCKQVSLGHMTCTPILKYNGHCGIEDPETMTSYEVECPN